MKNVMIIDGAENSVYDIFQFSNEQFSLIFGKDTDIAFIDEVEKRLSEKEFEKAFEGVWGNRISKKNVNGIHGIIFYELEKKKQYYPTRKDEEAINPDGSRLR